MSPEKTIKVEVELKVNDNLTLDELNKEIEVKIYEIDELSSGEIISIEAIREIAKKYLESAYLLENAEVEPEYVN
jgi:ribosomal protein S17